MDARVEHKRGGRDQRTRSSRQRTCTENAEARARSRSWKCVSTPQPPQEPASPHTVPLRRRTCTRPQASSEERDQQGKPQPPMVGLVDREADPGMLPHLLSILISTEWAVHASQQAPSRRHQQPARETCRGRNTGIALRKFESNNAYASCGRAGSQWARSQCPARPPCCRRQRLPWILSPFRAWP